METAKLTIKEGDKERTIFIPGADEMDKNELRDIIQWQEEKTRDDLRKTPTEQRKHSKKEVGQALRDYREFQQRKGEGTKKYY